MRRILWMSVWIMFLVACGQASTPPAVSPTTILLLPTDTPAPSNTAFPTKTPTLSVTPTTAFIPPAIEPVTMSPSALNETNASAQMELLHLLGTGSPTDISWSPDGNTLAVSTTIGLYLFDQGGLGDPVFHDLDYFKIDGPLTALAFSPDGQLLALAGGSQISLWSLTGQTLQKTDALDLDTLSVFELAWGKDGQIAATGLLPSHNYYTLVVWDASIGRKIFSEESAYLQEAFSPDGTLLAFQTDTGLKLAAAKTGKIIAEKNFYPQSLGFTPDGSRLVIIDQPQRGNSLIWDFSLDQQTPMGECPEALAWSASDVLCAGENEISFIDLASGKQTRSLEMNIKSYGSALTPNGSLLAMLDFNNDIHIFNMADGSESRFIPMGSFDAYRENKDIAVGTVTLQNKDVELVATVDRAGDIRLWSIEGSGHLLSTFKNGARVAGVAFNPDKRTLASLDINGILRLWDVQNGTANYIFDASSPLFPDGELTGPIAFGPDGTHLALFADSEKHLLDLRSLTHERFGTALLADREGSQFFFLPNGDPLDYSLNQGTFSLVDASTNEILLPSLDLHENAGFGGYSSEVEVSAIQPDGTMFAYATQEGILKVWDLNARKLLSSFKSHPKFMTMAEIRSVTSLAFSPHSNLLASVGADGTTRLWNARTGVELRRLNVCCYAAFTPSGRYLITAGSGVIRIWSITG